MGRGCLFAFIGAFLFTYAAIAAVIVIWPRTANDGQTGMLGMITMPFGALLGWQIAKSAFKEK